MIGSFLQNLFEAYRSPRVSARRMLDRAPSMIDCALMVVLATVIQAFCGEVVALFFGRGDPSMTGLGERMAELALQFFMFVLLTAGAYAIGRRFGGRATPVAMAQVIAWHYLATAFLAPLNLIGVYSIGKEGSVSPLFLLAPISLGISIWMFAAFVAEAHEFRRIGGVIAASVAGFVALGFVTMIVVSMFTVTPPPS